MMFERRSSRINVLFLIIQMEMGGSERVVYNLVSKLDRSVFQPFVAWFYGDKALTEYQELDIPLFHIEKNRGFDLSAMKKVSRIIQDNNIQVINAHHFMTAIYSFYGSKRFSTKLICTFHSAWEIDDIPWYWRRIGSLVLSNAHCTVGVSDEVTKRAQSVFSLNSAKSISVVNGVDEQKYLNCSLSEEVRIKIGIYADEIIIGNVANFRKVKNHLLLLRAFEKLLHDDYSVKLLLIGKGIPGDLENTESEIRAFIESRGIASKVIMLGYRPDVNELLSAMDIFCLSSTKEGLPISLLEAMAAGLPVVGTAVEGIKDVIQTDRNGVLVPENNVYELKKALMLLMDSKELRKRMGTESRKIIREKFSLDSCVASYQRLFLS